MRKHEGRAHIRARPSDGVAGGLPASAPACFGGRHPERVSLSAWASAPPSGDTMPVSSDTALAATSRQRVRDRTGAGVVSLYPVGRRSSSRDHRWNVWFLRWAAAHVRSAVAGGVRPSLPRPRRPRAPGAGRHRPGGRGGASAGGRRRRLRDDASESRVCVLNVGHQEPAGAIEGVLYPLDERVVAVSRHKPMGAGSSVASATSNCSCTRAVRACRWRANAAGSVALVRAASSHWSIAASCVSATGLTRRSGSPRLGDARLAATSPGLVRRPGCSMDGAAEGRRQRSEAGLDGYRPNGYDVRGVRYCVSSSSTVRSRFQLSRLGPCPLTAQISSPHGSRSTRRKALTGGQIMSYRPWTT